MSARITDVRLTPIAAARANIVCGHVIVEISTEWGVTGVGEMSDFQHLPMYHVDVADLERTLRSLLIGRDGAAINEIAALLERSFPSSESLYDKSGVIRCGVDIALWDLRSKTLGMNLSDLLGGRVRTALPIAYPIFRQRSADDIETNITIVRTMLERGFRRFRLYVGRDLGLDRRFLQRVTTEFADEIEIKSLDFSNLLDSSSAARFIEDTRHYGYSFVEAPARAHDLDGLRFVRERTLVPVSEHAVSERAALRLVAAGAVDVLNVGLFVLGGITPAVRVLSIAHAANVSAVIGTTQELSIGTAAAAHVGVTATADILASDPVGPLLYRRDVVETTVEFRDSTLLPPEGHGHGMQLAPNALQAAGAPLSWDDLDTSVIIDRTGSRQA